MPHRVPEGSLWTWKRETGSKETLILVNQRPTVWGRADYFCTLFGLLPKMCYWTQLSENHSSNLS